jgi:PleD family two-component response regulator
MQGDMVVNQIYEAGGIEECANVLACGKAVSLVLSSIDMPDTSPSELIAKIRSKRRFVPILIASSNGRDELPGDVLSAGAIDFVTTPCSAERLQEKVVRLACEFKCIYCGNCKQ